MCNRSLAEQLGHLLKAPRTTGTAAKASPKPVANATPSKKIKKVVGAARTRPAVEQAAPVAKATGPSKGDRRRPNIRRPENVVTASAATELPTINTRWSNDAVGIVFPSGLPMRRRGMSLCGSIHLWANACLYLEVRGAINRDLRGNPLLVGFVRVDELCFSDGRREIAVLINVAEQPTEACFGLTVRYNPTDRPAGLLWSKVIPNTCAVLEAIKLDQASAEEKLAA